MTTGDTLNVHSWCAYNEVVLSQVSNWPRTPILWQMTVPVSIKCSYNPIETNIFSPVIHLNLNLNLRIVFGFCFIVLLFNVIIQMQSLLRKFHSTKVSIKADWEGGNILWDLDLLVYCGTRTQILPDNLRSCCKASCHCATMTMCPWSCVS